MTVIVGQDVLGLGKMGGKMDRPTDLTGRVRLSKIRSFFRVLVQVVSIRFSSSKSLIMNTFQYASTSSFSEELPTPVGSANAFPNGSGWTSSTAGNELSAKRQNSSDHLGPAFKHQKTPSTSVTRNNEHVSTSDHRSLETECDRDGVQGMKENDIVHQRNLSALQDGSPESEVKVA